MSKKKLHKKLKNDPKFIPFNEKFDFDYIVKYIKTITVTENNISLIHNALNTTYFNEYYKELKRLYKEIVKKNKLSNNTFLEIIISITNRNLYLVSEKASISIKNKSETYYNEIINTQVNSMFPEIGLINAQAALEAFNDGLNSIINLSFQIENKNSNLTPEINQIENCVKTLVFANLYNVIKASYDMAIWEDYSIKHDNKKNLIKIKCNIKNHQALNRIGEYRLERNIFANKVLIINTFQEKNNFHKYMTSELIKKRKAKRLKNVKIVDGYISFRFADGFDKKELLQELLSRTEILTYYRFIVNEILPNLDQISLFDILLVFTEIQFLFNQAFEIKKEENSSSIDNLNLYLMKIDRNDIINYIYNKTKFTKKQVKQITELFIHHNGYLNIWEKPLMEIDNNIIPIMLPLSSPNLLRMTDYWLESGGFSLDKRGEIFEEHLKKILLEGLKRKKYQISIPNKSIFRNNNGEFEEIDLIAELKNITIIAEVKCIKYPFDPRDYHNMYKRLAEGTSQINRKTNFLKRNIKDFKQESFMHKPLFKIVITNYPIFSGYIINDVPITDASLIDNYFITGSLNKEVVASKDKGFQTKETGDSIIRYYNDENELSNNLSNFFRNPLPIIDKVEDVYFEETQISLPSSSPKIVMDYLKFKQSNII